jgi:UDP-galactopyranose mutase
MARRKIAIVGAGLSGATIAFELLWREEYDITVFDLREHVAGNAHTERDFNTGVMEHVYGPHVFHTNNVRVWNFIKQFGGFQPYIQRTKGMSGGKVYSLPINLHTINQFFDAQFSPDEARKFIASKCEPWSDPQNFEEQALQTVGPELYEAFLRDYTRKQWGMHPSKVPASVLKRLPLRFDYDDNAFNHLYQGIPTDGYTALVERMLRRRHRKTGDSV